MLETKCTVMDLEDKLINLVDKLINLEDSMLETKFKVTDLEDKLIYLKDKHINDEIIKLKCDLVQHNLIQNERILKLENNMKLTIKKSLF